MPLQKPLRVAVLFGGTGEEHLISRISAASVLRDGRDSSLTLLPVFLQKDGRWYIYRGSQDLPADAAWQPAPCELIPTFPVRLHDKRGFYTEDGIVEIDVVLPVLHGDGGEDGVVQGALTAAGLPYVGANTRTGALCTDKSVTKLIAAHCGIPVTPSVTLSCAWSFGEVWRTVTSAFGMPPPPLFIKPTSQGSSVGARPVRGKEELRLAFAQARTYGDVLVEQYLPHVRELEIAWLSAGIPVLSEVAQVISAGDFYDYTEKYTSGTADIRIPADIPRCVTDDIERYTARLVEAVGARDLCRIDFFLTQDNILYFNEINTFPGFTAGSLYPQLLSRMGISFPSLIRRLVGAAYARGI